MNIPELFTLSSLMVYYFPYYVMLVLLPLVLRATIERFMGIRPELACVATYESAFKDFVLTVLYFPLFEELLFRGLPYFIFGFYGIILGSFVWTVMHPAWQLFLIQSFPLRKKIAFTATSFSYYLCNAIFYSMIWLDGFGFVAVLYHMAHNGWLTVTDLLREVELPAPWKKYQFVSKKGISPRPVRGIKKKEEFVPRFVVRKTVKSLTDEVRETSNFSFVVRKVKNRD